MCREIDDFTTNKQAPAAVMHLISKVLHTRPGIGTDKYREDLITCQKYIYKSL